ncbi:MAG: DUF11 domain-containing protein, partial [Anaerolineae bacterium]|nr:DUF11 domain-containing protein [Anaerolineae bacterium]
MVGVIFSYCNFLTYKYKNLGLLIKINTPFLIVSVFLCAILWLAVTPIKAQGGILSVNKSAPSEIKAGETFTYTIQVHNYSSSKISVDITDPIPTNMTVVNSGSGVFTNGMIVWSDLLINPDSDVVVSFTAAVTQVGNVINADYEATSGLDTALGTPVTTTVKPSDPAFVTIDADPNSTVVNGSSNLIISITDLYGNPVEDGTAVSLDFDKGTVDGQSPGTTI